MPLELMRVEMKVKVAQLNSTSILSNVERLVNETIDGH
jgi:hypothetical protein